MVFGKMLTFPLSMPAVEPRCGLFQHALRYLGWQLVGLGLCNERPVVHVQCQDRF